MTPFPPYVSNARLKAWVSEAAALCTPKDIHWCDGSEEEYRMLCDALVDSGTFLRLNEAKRPNSFLARSDVGDVARVEDRTFICSLAKDDAGIAYSRRRYLTEAKRIYELLDKRLAEVPYIAGQDVTVADSKRFMKMVNRYFERIRSYPLHPEWISLGMQRTWADTMRSLGRTGSCRWWCRSGRFPPSP